MNQMTQKKKKHKKKAKDSEKGSALQLAQGNLINVWVWNIETCVTVI